MRRWLAALAGVAIAVLFAPAAWARTIEIEAFDTTIRVGADSTVTFEERLRVRFEGQWNGILRNIPYGYTYPGGVRGDVGIEIDSIQDERGRDLEYGSKRRGGEVRLKIRVPGARDAVRTVVIRYRARNAMRRIEEDEPEFGAHDQLYWNVIGTGWDLPIRRATATVYLPGGVAALPAASVKTTAYTGAYGARGRAVASTRREDGSLLFETTEALEPFHGLTIVVGFPPGHVSYPTFLQRVLWFLGVNWFVLIPVLLLGLWIVCWWRFGRDALAGRTIIPEFEPPMGLRPSEVGVLMDDKLDRRDVTAAIVDLAVRQVLTIHDEGEDGDRRLVLDRRRMPGADLNAYEKRLLKGLFGKEKDEVALDSLTFKFHKKVPAIHRAVVDRLVSARLFPRPPEKVVASWIGRTLLVLAAAVTAGILLSFPLPYWIALVLCGIGMFLVVPHMPRRTKKGLDALAGIRGMQEYMVTAEEQRLASLPMGTFEKLLPYAVAFGIHERWIEAFARLFERPPDWYVSEGTGWRPAVLAGGIDNLQHDVGSKLYRAPRATTSGSRGWGGGWSGGGGFSGGSSGGGFGGGGGGGW